MTIAQNLMMRFLKTHLKRSLILFFIAQFKPQYKNPILTNQDFFSCFSLPDAEHPHPVFLSLPFFSLPHLLKFITLSPSSLKPPRLRPLPTLPQREAQARAVVPSPCCSNHGLGRFIFATSVISSEPLTVFPTIVASLESRQANPAAHSRPHLSPKVKPIICINASSFLLNLFVLKHRHVSRCYDNFCHACFSVLVGWCFDIHEIYVVYFIVSKKLRMCDCDHVSLHISRVVGIKSHFVCLYCVFLSNSKLEIVKRFYSKQSFLTNTYRYRFSFL